MAHYGLHSKVAVEKRAQTWDSVFIKVKSGGLRLQGLLLIGEFEA